jgi:hypothetical protein
VKHPEEEGYKEIGRRGLRVRLEHAADIEIVGECRNGVEAIKSINLLSPDLELSGFGVLRSARPKVPHMWSLSRHLMNTPCAPLRFTLSIIF